MSNVSVYITGDKHGSFSRMLNKLNKNISRGSVIVILGDVGLNYYGNEIDIGSKQQLNESGYTFICLRGNHEARPTGTDKYITNDKFGGTFIVEEEYPNILYMKDGYDYRFTVNGKRRKVIAIGGAYSVDKHFRIVLNKAGYSEYKWFEDEQLNESERERIINKLSDYSIYDYVFSHTCPYELEPRDMFLSGLDQSTVDNTMEYFLQDVANMSTFETWYCGHWHTDRTVNQNDCRYRFMYDDIIELGE